MRRTLLALSLAIVLTACSSSSTNTNTLTATCASKFWNGTVGTCLPQAWHAVDAAIMQDQGFPQEVVAAFQSDTDISGVYPSVIVTRQTMKTTMTPEEFAAASVQAVSVLPAYRKLDQRTVTIDGRQIPLIVYSARLRTDRPEQRYYQLSTIAGRSGFTFSGALPLSVDTALEQRVLLILQNATFQEPITQAPAAQ